MKSILGTKRSQSKARPLQQTYGIKDLSRPIAVRNGMPLGRIHAHSPSITNPSTTLNHKPAIANFEGIWRRCTPARLHPGHRFFSMSSAAIKVVLVPVLSDNYCYLLIDEASKQAAVVDAQEPQKYDIILI